MLWAEPLAPPQKRKALGVEDSYANSKVRFHASAVTNALFGVPPGNELGRQFLSSHQHLVDREFPLVREEPDICYMVSLLAHLKANIAGNTASFTGDQLLWFKKLDDAGILLPIEEIGMPDSIDDLLVQVRAFERSIMQRTASLER